MSTPTPIKRTWSREPWKSDLRNARNTNDADGRTVGTMKHTSGEATLAFQNARRQRACVNAMVGIAPTTDEPGSVRRLVEALTEARHHIAAYLAKNRLDSEVIVAKCDDYLSLFTTVEEP